MNDNALIQLDNARLALSQCKTVMESKQIADIAEAARIYLERTNASAETVNRATEIRLLAERQMGEFLKAMPKNKGGRPNETDPDAGKDSPPTMAEIGIHRKHVERAQELADIPAEDFHARIERVKESGEKLTRTAIVKTRRPISVFSKDIWKRQTRSVMRSWLESVPEDQREDAVAYLTNLPSEIYNQIK